MCRRQDLIKDDQLEKAVEHIAYEVRILAFAAEYLEWGHSSPATPPEGDEKNVFLESFLLHYRNLLVFLCPVGHQVRKSDVVASDYLCKSTPENIGRRDRLIDADGKDRLDRMLAHITSHRKGYVEAGDTWWPTATMCATMLGEFRRFVNQLTPAWRERFHRQPEIKRLLSDNAQTLKER